MLLVAVVAVGLEALWWFGRPPIIRGIPASFFRNALPDGRDVYRQRVRAAFPTGIPETELLTSLAEHGYEIRGANGLGRRYARIHDTLFLICFVDWGVYWRADNAGIVTEVEHDILSLLVVALRTIQTVILPEFLPADGVGNELQKPGIGVVSLPRTA
jgi:hypothetical protein